MKVTCQQCGAAYSVADSKVEGRKVKLRCKQCDEAMIIDGTVLGAGTALGAGAAVRADAHDELPAAVSLSAPALEPATVDQVVPASSSGAAEFEPVGDQETAQVNPLTASWHIAVGDETQGPYALDEVARYYAEGRISADTLVYFDGASDWHAASDIAELTDAAAAFAPPPLRPTVPPPRRSESRRVEPVTMGSDPFDDYAPAPVSRPLGADDMLSSTRHEGTVQFSLDAIRAISAVSSPSVVPGALASSANLRPAAASSYSGSSYSGLTSPGYTSPGYTSSASVAPGYASGEGSGLIDVSAMSAQQHEETPFHVISSAQRSPLDMTSSFGTLNEGRGGVDLRTKIFAGLTAFGFVLVAGVAAIVLTQPQQAQPVAAASALPMQAGMAAIPVPAPAPAPAIAARAEQVAAEPAAAEPSDDGAADEPAAVASKSRPHTVNAKRASGKRVTAEVAAAKAPIAAPAKEKEPKAKAGAKAASDDFDDLLAGAPAKKPVAKGGDSIDDLLDSAVSAKKQPPKAEKAEAPPIASGLPATPSRDDMRAAYGKATAKASKCKGSGVANADVTIAGSSGRATSVNVSGVEGAAKSCVESAVKSTSFPKFAKDTMQVKFPFKLPG